MTSLSGWWMVPVVLLAACATPPPAPAEPVQEVLTVQIPECPPEAQMPPRPEEPPKPSCQPVTSREVFRKGRTETVQVTVPSCKRELEAWGQVKQAQSR